jgi:hypothetical protein
MVKFMRLAAMLLYALAAADDAYFAGGDGSEQNPFLIADSTQLRTLSTLLVNREEDVRYAYNRKCYKLTANIDLSGYENWRPIGDYGSLSTFFGGSFDGNGHVISGLKIEAGSYGGLFGRLQGATVRNLGIENADITDSHQYIGAVAGAAYNSLIENFYATGSIKGLYNVGGIVGESVASTVRNCWTTAAVAGTARVGGIVGYSNHASSKVENCAALNLEVANSSSFKQDFGRISGTLNGIFSNNVAFSGMEIAGDLTIGSASNRNGAGKTLEELQTASGWPQVFSESPWTYQAGKLPAFGKTIAMPWYLGTESFDFIKAMSIIAIALNFYQLADTTANAEQAKAAMQAIIDALDLGEGIAATVNNSGSNPFAAASNGTPANPLGTRNGSYKFTVSLSKNSSQTESDPLTIAISSSAYKFAGGSGTKQSPYLIADSTQLRALATLTNSLTSSIREAYANRHYKLIADIDLSGYENWTPIGSWSRSFKGVFNGNGKKVTGLKIAIEDDYQGLFGKVAGGSIDNLGVEGSVSGAESVGGIVGSLEDGAIANSYSTATVSGEQDVGGIVGVVIGSSVISNCAAMNPSIERASGSNTTYFGRVAGDISREAILKDNIAFEDMTVIGSIITDGTSANKHGQSKTAAELQEYLDYLKEITPVRLVTNRITLKDIPQGAKVEVYNLSGKRMNGENLPKGIYIIKSNNRIFKTVK